jgi:hypothetical protein
MSLMLFASLNLNTWWTYTVFYVRVPVLSKHMTFMFEDYTVF